MLSKLAAVLPTLLLALLLAPSVFAANACHLAYRNLDAVENEFRQHEINYFLNLLQAIRQKATNEGLSVSEAITQELKNKGLTERQIQSRLEKSREENPNWSHVLGELTLAETHEMFYGGNIQAVSPDSLLGKYIQRSGARTRLIRVPLKFNNYAELGNEKLVVAVSANSFEEFQKTILSNLHYMSVVGHANIMHNGSFYAYTGNKSPIRAPGVNTPIPMLLLKTSEALRLNRYMEAATLPVYASWYTTLKQPWRLPGYSAQGAYGCCTHWIGNIPIGDTLVRSYRFPGQAGYDRGGVVAPGGVAAEQELRPYQPLANDAPVITQIWKAPGHQQLAQVIDQDRANVDGELASPGWVIQTLLGPTSNERVPVIFLMTNDHQQEIPEQPVFNFENPV